MGLFVDHGGEEAVFGGWGRGSSGVRRGMDMGQSVLCTTTALSHWLGKTFKTQLDVESGLGPVGQHQGNGAVIDPDQFR